MKNKKSEYFAMPLINVQIMAMDNDDVMGGF